MCVYFLRASILQAMKMNIVAMKFDSKLPVTLIENIGQISNSTEAALAVPVSAPEGK